MLTTRLILCVIALVACVMVRAEHNQNGGGGARPAAAPATTPTMVPEDSAKLHEAIQEELAKMSEGIKGVRAINGHNPSDIGEPRPLADKETLARTNFSTARVAPSAPAAAPAAPTAK